jgi:pilus assembly protein CpaC
MLTRRNSATRHVTGPDRHDGGAPSVRQARERRLSQRLSALLAVALLVAQIQTPLPAQDPLNTQGQSAAPAPLANPASATPAPLPGADDREVLTDAIFHVTGRRGNVEVTENLSKVMELSDSRIIRVDGFDPTVIDVKALTPHRIRVQALIQGVTTLVLTDEEDRNYVIEVFVKGDTRHLQAVIDNRFPDSAVEAYKIQDNVALTGWVAQPEHITQIVEIAEQFYPRVLNQMRVGGVQQVQLKVRIMEAQRSKMRRMGFDFIAIGQDAFFRSNPAGLFSLESVTAGAGGVAAALAGNSINGSTTAFGLVSDNNTLFGFFDALREEELLKILAEPVLITTNGRPASMLSGGEFPVLVPQSLGVVSIEWRDFGVRMEAVPVILGDGRVRLEVMPEVSERDFANSVTVGGNVVPALTTRRVNTEVEMRFGETLMLTGLISSRQTAQTSKLPVLGELPWVGALFRKTSYDDVETELIITLTPELVAPMQQHQVPHAGPGGFSTFPTDRELFLDGYLEVPKYGDECQNCGRLGTCSTGQCLTSAAAPKTFATPIRQETTPAIDPSRQSAERTTQAPELASAAQAALRDARPSSVRVTTETLPIAQRTTADPTGQTGSAQQVNYSQPLGSPQAVLPASVVQGRPSLQNRPAAASELPTQLRPSQPADSGIQRPTSPPTRPAATTSTPQNSTMPSAAAAKKRPPATWNPFAKKPQLNDARSRSGSTAKIGSGAQSGTAGQPQMQNRASLPGLIEP